MKTSLIVTLLNEEGTIEELLHSVILQSLQPDEVIIIDGGSTDSTLSVISNFHSPVDGQISKKSDLSILPKIKVLTKKGNRSVGRNEAVKRSSGDVILITDAGCTLDKNWVKEIIKPFKDTSVDVVAGYYRSRSETIFQKCLTPFALVMPDRVDAKNFLPATRSMAIRKAVFIQSGGFNEYYSHNEDYVFANTLRNTGKKIVFTKLALVNWIPRRTFREAFVMFYRFAYGDIQSGILRPKVIMIFVRYLLATIIFIYAVISNSGITFVIIGVLSLVYLIWAVVKNFRYVLDWHAIYYLPLLQLISDIAIIKGSMMGGIKKYGV